MPQEYTNPAITVRFDPKVCIHSGVCVRGLSGVLVAVGLTLGVLGALLLARLMQGLLFGVAPHDPVTLAGVTLIMAVVGIRACWIPAMRAARIDPGIALRAQ